MFRLTFALIALTILSFGCSQSQQNLHQVHPLFPIVLDGKSGFIDGTGKIVIRPQFEQAYWFDEGIGVVAVGHQWRIVGNQGNIQGSVQSSTLIFGEGLAAADGNEKWGYVDEQGNSVIKFQFDKANVFSEGLAAVEKGNKWGYIDKNGRIVCDFQFDEAGNFRNGLAAVGVGDKTGYIDKTGRMIWNPSK